jgi:signal transduction histidine kinase
MPLELLLIDDDAVDRETVRRTLRAAGLDVAVTEVATADAAFEAVDSRRYDCILLDYRLPGTDGLAVLEALRWRGIDTPVIALTGLADQQTAVAVMKAGAADYVTKDNVTPDRLERSIRHALQVAAGERERRALLAREQQARLEAQAANRAKDEFLATLSHELRTPLNSILGWAHLLASGSLDAEGSRRALETIQRNARLQAKLIDDLLDISRIVTGKLTIERAAVSLATLVAAAVESHRPAAALSAVELTYTAPPDDRAVTGDAARLQQVVTNLLSNALKFTSEGGRVDVRLEFGPDDARLVVADSGVGIAPDFLPHVFEQFRQADASTTRRQGGLGLGLAIVRRLVELHGGTVVAESEGLGRGATFTVTVPAAAAADEDPEAAAPAPARLAGISVLVVDDDADGRAFVVTVLEQLGARVLAAETAGAALALARRERPDILLTDIAMPRLDGYGLLREFRLAMPGIPAAAVTACVSPEDRARAREAGFAAHLGKPIDPNRLVETVQALCRNLPRPAR